MSLYDDIATIPKDKSGGSPAVNLNPSQIKLLQDHLKLKKNQLSSGRPAPRQVLPPRSTPILPVSIVTPNIHDELKNTSSSSTGSLLGGDWDITQEYDPARPNDYEKVVKERRERKERERQQQSIQIKSLKTFVPYSDDEDDDGPSSSSSKPSVGAAIPPPIELLQPPLPEPDIPPNNVSAIASSAGVSATAAKIMARMGYREGQGLGANEQGISKPLEVRKVGLREGMIVSSDELPPPPSFNAVPPPPSSSTSQAPSSPDITELMKNPTKVVLLTNMVGPGEVDEDLEPETKEECSKYGEVVKCVIFEVPGPGVPAEEAVRIFIEFKRIESAIKAIIDLNGRFFGGRSVKASFFDYERFKKLDLADRK